LYVYTGGSGGGVTFDYDGTRTGTNTYDGGWNGGGTGNNTNAGGGGGASDIRRNEFTVTNKALTSNIATLTTSAVHGFTVGGTVVVAGVDATFNGTYTIATVPTTTKFTYAKTASNVTSTASSGTVRGPSAATNTTSIASRVVVAGGGGGAGYWAGGGLGGGLIGGSSTGSSGTTSYGGTQTTGFALGTGKSVFGTGTSVNAGGGGGGYWGGGVSTGNNPGGGGGSSWVSTATLSSLDSRTASGVTHTQGVRTGDGYVALSTPDTGALRVPVNVQATGQLGQVSLNWTASPIEATTGYRLMWGTSLGAITNQIDITGASTSSYVHTGRAVGTTYYYQLAAMYSDYSLSCTTACVSGYSTTVFATPIFTSDLTFAYTGAPVAYVVPQGVTWLQVDLQAGQGGTAGTNGYVGGLGGRTQATIPVTAGETLYVYTGGSGGGATFNYDGSRTATNTYDGGWNGGGTGNNTNAGGGGGASDIRRNEFTVSSASAAAGTVTLTTSIAHGIAVGASVVVAGLGAPFDGTYTTISGTTASTIKFTVSSVSSATASGGTVRGPSSWSNSVSLASRAIIAGGGGGAGYWAGGGLGGGLIGGSSTGASGNTSYGGTQTTGFALGTGKSVFGTGTSVNAGGGGGGYWGGGVSTGNNPGGGGGSSWVSEDAAAVFHTQGYRTGDGRVLITVPLSASAAGLAAAAGDQQVALSWSESATSNLLGYSILGGTTPNPTTIIATVDNTVSSYLHQGPSVAVTNRALTANVVTLTTSSAHGFSVGQSVKVSDIGSPFNGTFVITAVPTTTTLTYAKTNANIASATTIGTATVASGLTNGTTYYYRVAPILLLSDVRTTASYSSVVSATPTTLTAGTYAYSGAPTLFTVPTGVSWLQVDAQAGQGGTAGSNGYVGGQGGRTQATIPVTAGEKLYLYIGGAGGRAGSSPSANTYAAGWNGGGTGNNTNAGGGGGASDIRRNEFTVTNKALTSNVATLTTSAAHGFAVGASASVADIDATFNGTYVVTSVPTTTTFTFAKTAANV
ncbi:MAG: hypothetical protein F2889_07275, partial [Actinobacteria bacterium]|nr:hypothetical protein [Actinomycetota bacterium]